jgi:hypothetical protein
LYDVSNQPKKISEDFYFHLNEEGMIEQCVPDPIRKSLSESKSATFTVTYPNPDVSNFHMKSYILDIFGFIGVQNTY